MEEVVAEELADRPPLARAVGHKITEAEREAIIIAMMTREEVLIDF